MTARRPDRTSARRTVTPQQAPTGKPLIGPDVTRHTTPDLPGTLDRRDQLRRLHPVLAADTRDRLTDRRDHGGVTGHLDRGHRRERGVNREPDTVSVRRRDSRLEFFV